MACHNPVLRLVADGMTSVTRLVLQGRVRVISPTCSAFYRKVDAYGAVVHVLCDREPEQARTAMQGLPTLATRGRHGQHAACRRVTDRAHSYPKVLSSCPVGVALSK